MSSRRERCGWCGLQLWVPADARTFRCGSCQTITGVQPYTSPNHGAGTGAYLPNVFSGYTNSAVGAYGHGYGYGHYGQANSLPFPAPPRSMLPLPSAHGRKRALLCGVSYRGMSYKIKGSDNDVNCMKYFLVEKMGFPSDSILTLKEDEINPLRIPTKANIRMALRWLVQSSQPGDSLVFHFSGHGSRQRDYNMDEVDGMDETLCPLDFETEGMIIDDEINATIVRPLPKGATLHAIIDSCYSGTVLDLPFQCRMNREGYYMWEDHRCSPLSYKGTSGGLALSISACDDNQISLDTTAMAGTTSTGALTYSFIQAVQIEPGLTYGRLLNSMRQAIRRAGTGGLRLNGPIASVLNRTLFRTEMSQEPQLSSSEKFDIYSKQFMM